MPPAAGRLDAAWAVLYGAAILWDLGFDTIYAHQDREDDALVGVKSTARLFGERTAPFLAACYAARCCCWRWPAGSPGWVSGFIRRWRCRRCCWRGRSGRWTSTTRQRCLRLFRANREAGLAVAAAILIGWL